ncbi:MAG: VOC family protein [Deltaproteobacteria bacterium]|nr:VOC family protein [Deltaproteobacteria bacterium]
MNENEKISYIEFPTKDIESTKKFFSTVFGWSFSDYGDEYSVVANAGVNAGFFKSEQNSSVANGSVLIVIYCKELKKTQQKVEQAGGSIVKPTFEFPGGCRFHFTDPNGNEYGVWSEKDI